MGGELDSSYSSHVQIYKRNAEDEWGGTVFSFFYHSKMPQSILIMSVGQVYAGNTK